MDHITPHWEWVSARPQEFPTVTMDVQVVGGSEKRQQQLGAFLANFWSGNINVGSRTPLDGVPAWVTPEITKEGFATGRLVAELAPGAKSSREWATPEGLGEFIYDTAIRLCPLTYAYAATERLSAMVDSGCYNVRFPENAALLVVARLKDAGHEAKAANLLKELDPWMDRLQFYPEPIDRPAPQIYSELVRLLTVRETISVLEARAAEAPSKAAEAFRRAVTELRPLYHELVTLFLDTVPCPDKLLVAVNVPEGVPFKTKDDAWPCQLWGDDWMKRGKDLAARCKLVEGASKFRRRHACKLLTILRLVLTKGPTALSGRDVGMVRIILVDFARKYGGAPGSEGFAVVSPKFLSGTRFGFAAAYIPVLVARLRALADQDDGCVESEALTAPISVEEADAIGKQTFVRPGDAIPPGLARTVKKCTSASLEKLIDLGVVSSLEMMCPFVNQIVSEAAPIADSRYRLLFSHVCARVQFFDFLCNHIFSLGISCATAFSLFFANQNSPQIYRSLSFGRRSLLLLNLEHRVSLADLPWARAMDAFKELGAEDQVKAREALLTISRIALTRFPGDAVPNKLQQDLRALASQAGVSAKDHPLLEGLAADIFMNRFSQKFRDGALAAARFVRAEAPLYERFWGLHIIYSAILDAEGSEEFNFDALILGTVVGSRVEDPGTKYWIAENHEVSFGSAMLFIGYQN